MKWMTKAMAAILVTTVVAGCGFAGRGDDPIQREEDEECADCGEEWSVEEPSNGDPNNQQVPDEPCGPEPTAAATAQIPEVPDEVLDGSCPLEEQLVDRSGDPARTTTWEWDGETLEKRRTTVGGLEEEIDFVFSSNPDTPQRIERRTYRSHAFFDADERIRTRTWHFDDRGRLVKRTYELKERDGDAETIVARGELTQTWQGDRLVERVEVDDGQTPQQRRYEWSWDDEGRLATVRYFENGESFGETSWNYKNGRPASVERREGGRLVERQTWSYAADGRLQHREISLEEGGPVRAYDTYSSLRYDSVPRNANAHLRAEEGDRCYQLPGSPAHGYPVDESAYGVGWKVADPDAPDFDPAIDHFGRMMEYGVSPYAASPRRLRYGHLGAATQWPSADAMETRIDYDESGRMVEEHRTLARDDNPDLEMSRTRQFEEDRLVDDHLELQRDDAVVDARLRFERTADRLVRKRLRNGEERARQIWRYEDGDAVEYDIRIETSNQYMGRRLSVLFEETSPPQTTRMATHRRTLDEQNRIVESSTTPRSDAGSARTDRRERSYTEHGLVQEVRTRQSAPDESFEVLRRSGNEYDDQGRLVREWVDRDGDGEPEDETVYERDDAGRLVEEIQYRSSEISRHVRYDFACRE